MSAHVTHTTKLSLIGETGVGKSSVAMRFASDSFTQFTEPTIGAAYLSKLLELDSHSVRFQLWDTAGQERYRALAPIYFRNSSIVLIVYDCTKRASFDGAKDWLKRVRASGTPGQLVALVANKNDLGASRTVTSDSGAQFAEAEDIEFFEVSAKTGDGVDQLFRALGERVPEIERRGRGPPPIVVGDADSGWAIQACCTG